MDNTFDNGLKGLFTKGSLYSRTYLTPRAKEILLIMIEESLEKTCHIEDEDEFERFVSAMYYLQSKLKEVSFPVPKLNLKIAATLHYWIADNVHHHLSSERDFDRATQFVVNLWTKEYAISEFLNPSLFFPWSFGYY